MASIADQLADLKVHVDQLNKEFLSEFIPAKAEDKPENFEHRVKAFCVLAHAAFEEFAEVISLQLMASSIDAWYTKRQITRTLLSLCLFYKVSISAEPEEEVSQARSFDLVREAIDRAKELHSKAIFGNHGFSLKYLRNALTSVGVDVPVDPILMTSLSTLAEARGSYAHTRAKLAFFQSKRAKRPMTPEEARDAVEDCFRLCEQIGAAAAELLK